MVSLDSSVQWHVLNQWVEQGPYFFHYFFSTDPHVNFSSIWANLLDTEAQAFVISSLDNVPQAFWMSFFSHISLLWGLSQAILSSLSHN